MQPATHLSPSETRSLLKPPPVALPMVSTPRLWGTFSIMRPSYLHTNQSTRCSMSMHQLKAWDMLVVLTLCHHRRGSFPT